MNPRNPWFVAGFLAGGALGAAGALLAAPARGEDLIDTVREQFDAAKREAREAGQRAEADVLTRYKAIRNASGAPQLSATSGVYVSPRDVTPVGATAPGNPGTGGAR